MIDKGLIEMFGPYGLATIFSFLSQQFVLLQTGFIYNYSLLILISTLFLINILFFSITLNFNFSIIFLLFLIFIILKVIDNKNI
jgi:NADH-ubiquinone oxidoreductase chain 5